MYDWLVDALSDDSHLVTASRRLARELNAEYGRRQLAAGKQAWRTPTILAYPDWLAMLLAGSDLENHRPTRLNNYQALLLWERSLRQETNYPLLNFQALARQASDAWNRLQQWQVTLDACEASAAGADKHMFVRAARRYQAHLESRQWVDPPGIPAQVTQLIAARRLPLPGQVKLVGFDRIVPEVATLLATLNAAGCDAGTIATDASPGVRALHRYENPAAEMRAAGAWARALLEQDPDLRIGVVMPGLERNALSAARLLREGFAPGWQTAGRAYAATVNASYGRSLATYPAIAIALGMLRWLHTDLSTLELSQLLRTPALGLPTIDGRARLELRLRRMPDRRWSPAMLAAVAGQAAAGTDAQDWLRRVQEFAAHRSQLGQRRPPAEWAEFFDRVLRALNWPGAEALSSDDYQLVNRWRELLNDFARLDVVAPVFTLPEACSRLAALAGEIVFQPEEEGALVHLLGPLEAAGLQFDRLWIAGFSASNWPPVAKPLALVSRDLQRDTGMPDADPSDTLEYAMRVLERLVGSSAECVLSYAQTDGDEEQVVSSLMTELDLAESQGPDDPGWYASRYARAGEVRTAASDPVPAVAADEAVSGGAVTLQRQFSEPFAAFVHGRLGVNLVYPIAPGLAPNIRGNLLHDALQALYAHCPHRDEIAAWNNATIDSRVERALQVAFADAARNADELLQHLLDLEQIRAGKLLRDVIAVDTARPAFAVAAVENSVAARIAGVSLQLRYDRVDRDADGAAIILDYKTGRPRQLLERSGEPRDMQLVAYSMALDQPVAAIGLFNVDARGTNLDMAGAAYTPGLDWAAALEEWQAQVVSAATELAGGDVRLGAELNTAQSRPLGLLSRYRELRHES